MATETLEPPTQTFTPPKSFLDDPKSEVDWQAAIDADARASNAEKAAKTSTAPEVKTETSAAVPVVAATKTEAKDDEPPTDISEAGKNSWQRLKESKKLVEKERETLRGERDTTAKERDTFKARIDELEKAAKTPAQQVKLEDSAEYKQLQALLESKGKELEEYSERLRLVEVTEHPRFKKYFSEKTEAQFALAKNLAGDKVLEILKMPAGELRDEKLNELAVDLSPLKQAQLGTVLTRLQEIEDERSREIANARDNYQKIMAEQQAAQLKERESIFSTFKNVTNEVTSAEKGLSVFQERNGDDAWNSGVKERLAIAQAAYAGKLKPEDLARNAYWGAAAPALLTELNGATAKITALEKQITELRAAGPSPGGDRPGGGSPIQSDKKGLDAMMENIEAAMPSR